MLSRKILLAYPRFPDETFWSFERALAMTGRSSTMPPLGLLTVAALFPARGYELELHDENLRAISDEALRDADLVLASAMVVQQEALEGLVLRCRELGTTVMVGGPLVSGCYEQLIDRGFDPDVWFLGEAEELFAEVIDDFERGALRKVYAHVPTADRELAVRTALGSDARVLRGPLPALDRSPLPRFDLLEPQEYHSMAIQASRGCPIGCEFCDIWVQFGRKSRTGRPARLLRQLDALKLVGWSGRVFIVDDNFIGNLNAARELLPELAVWQHENGEPFSFCTEADVRLGDDAERMEQLREQLAAAGFGAVFLGIETPSAASLAETGKRVNIARDGDVASGLLARVQRIQRAGLEVKAGFILGFDNDPPDIDEAMIEFVSRSAIPLAMVGTLGVLPGTALQARLEREGRYRGRLVGTQTHGFALNYQPLHRSEHSVLEQYARVLDALFGDEMRTYFARCDQLMERLPAPPRTGDRLNKRGLRTLLRSIRDLRPRISYLRFVLRTLTRRPRFVPYAVALAIQGEHLHRLTQLALEEYRGRPVERAESALSGSLACLVPERIRVTGD
jgi:radical SAM superfamily enzyme YgiQ (UPF0313 family)